MRYRGQLARGLCRLRFDFFDFMPCILKGRKFGLYHGEALFHAGDFGYEPVSLLDFLFDNTQFLSPVRKQAFFLRP
ncbi:hypothetical protein CDS [Bradyrhizobium sp.]|nr:hypothetical protein CDS [Bradyrhizobium sp.]